MWLPIRHRRLLALAVACGAGVGISSAWSEAPVSRYIEPYPQATSKKGLQVENIDDALALGIKHAALNVYLASLVAPQAQPGEPAHLNWNYAGQPYCFDAAKVEQLDRRIRALSSQGVHVYLILLIQPTGFAPTDTRMLHPGYDQAAPNRLSAPNSVTAEGRQWLAATMEFLAERWSRPDQEHGRVVGYIVGNEVNSHWWWSNQGRVTMTEFVDDYADAVRLVHDAVRRQASWPRIYISLEHHWNMRFPAADELQGFPGRDFLDRFAARVKETGDFPWHVAFHPYPEDLFDPVFWHDETAMMSEDTPRITFKNLEVLVDYLREDKLLWQGEPRRIILSEQGFHTPEGPDGELIQAAAYCYAYRKVARLDGVDAFILHRQVDHPHEGGLLLGLRRMPNGRSKQGAQKRIYECFRLADTDQWEEAFQFALPVIGISDWSEL